jgi:cyclopropane-fatty-acyl-phospholipid synthase
VSGEIAHPLIVPLPRLAAPAARALRHVALTRLRAMWNGAPAEHALPLDLALASGEVIRLGGGGPAPRVRIHDDRLFLRLVLRGELGAGEAFAAGEWSSDDLVGVTRAFLRASGARGVESPLTRLGRLPELLRHRRAANTLAGSQRNVHAHYDLGNAFYRQFLDDDTLAYSCALFREPALSLADAQRAKLDQLCDWLALSPRDHLLEIGCGWGGMAIHAARTRGCRVTAITLSREQHALASERVAAAGLTERVSIEYRDYRDLAGAAPRVTGAPRGVHDAPRRFDKIVSIEMLEQVGFEHLPRFFATCARVLAPRGRLAIQTITMPDERFAAYRRSVDWMQTYIFPGTLIPSIGAIRAACAPLSIAHSEDIGPSYAPTLRAWRERFVAALPAVRALGFDAPFIRTWLLYLAFSEAAFSERTLGDHQLLFAR